MAIFNSLQQILQKRDKILHLCGPEAQDWAFLMGHFVQSGHQAFQRPQVIICPEVELTEEVFRILGRKLPNRTLHFPGLEVTPYGNILPSQNNVHRQFYALTKIAQGPEIPWIVVTTLEAALLKVPPSKFFVDNQLTLEAGKHSPAEPEKKLIELGYSSTPSVEEPGTFCRKGEILDLHPLSADPVRIHHFDDMIERIYPIDLESQASLRERPLERVRLSASPFALCAPEAVSLLRSRLPSYGPSQKAKHEAKKRLLAQLGDAQLFEEYPFFIPLFFAKCASLLEHFQHTPLVTFLESHKCQQRRLELLEELRSGYQDKEEDAGSPLITPDPKFLYHNNLDIPEAIHVDNITPATPLDSTVNIPLKNARSYLNHNIIGYLSKPDFLKQVIIFLAQEFRHNGNIIFVSETPRAMEEFKHLLELFDQERVLAKKIVYQTDSLESGFFYPPDKTLVLADSDLFSQKKAKTKSQTLHDIDLFAEQIASLKPGDYVVHTEYGLGRYLGLTSLNVDGLNKTDFMILAYANDDKIYVPVYKFNLVQKYAEAESKPKINSLRNNKFATLKNKAQKSAKKLAFDLLKLQAARETAKSFEFSPPDRHYKEFELTFPFRETHDQLTAIEQVLQDMQRPRPMDRLVCGDVGFGKTEVAMRAAFKAVEDGKQVAVLVPTTILALQHHANFTERFKEFPINIDFLSRFKTAKEAKLIKQRLKDGSIDIVIGTHKLLAADIEFDDLGLVVVDEEQRFGVGHKEKLKLLKSSVDFLTLTATPIPRTLQLAFLGLRDLSLIQTAPPKRQAIKSYIIREDWETIKKAIENELRRGGQVFIVHNRINDIEIYKNEIARLLPNARILIAHGQLPERELEKRIKAFYSKEYQILICTTIIENGIDIPNVNTMIIDRAETYGLSQLHQLRGRIGRSDRKAYAWFVIPNQRNLKELAQRRIKTLQTYADIGSGFNIATCDLEIRGAGDILGANQSGHIEAVGLELYMELLKESIRELKGEKKGHKSNVELNAPFDAYIPSNYIRDDSNRLKYYKKISNIEEPEKLEATRAKLEDIYGPAPREVDNLFTILQARMAMGALGLAQLNVGHKSIHLVFDQEWLKGNPGLQDGLLKVFMKDPKTYQFSPNFEVTCRLAEVVKPTKLLDFCQKVSRQVAKLC